jgi:hypothetical protein
MLHIYRLTIREQYVRLMQLTLTNFNKDRACILIPVYRESNTITRDWLVMRNHIKG